MPLNKPDITIYLLPAVYEKLNELQEHMDEPSRSSMIERLLEIAIQEMKEQKKLMKQIAGEKK